MKNNVIHQEMNSMLMKIKDHSRKQVLTMLQTYFLVYLMVLDKVSIQMIQ